MRPQATSHREIELKFSVPPKRFKELKSFFISQNGKSKHQVLEERELTLEDTYFDSSAFDLARHCCTLRVRKTEARGNLLTFKRAGIFDNEARADRVEIEGLYILGTLDKITRETPWLLLLDRPTPDSLPEDIDHEVLRNLGLEPILTLHNRRTVHTVEFRNGLICEVCLDRVGTIGGKKSVEFDELECEYISGDLKLLEDFEKYLRKQFPWLKSSKSSKYERGLRSLKLWKRTKAMKEDEVGKWHKRLNKVFDRFNRNYALMLQFKEEEDLHSCRVALRQLITMFGFLGTDDEPSPQLEKLKRRFTKIQKTLGRLRDRDVYFIYANLEPVLQLSSEQLQSDFLHVIQLERDHERLQAMVRLPKYYNKGLQKEWKTFMSKHLSKLVRQAHIEDQYIALIHRFEEAHQSLVYSRSQLGAAHPHTVKQLHRTRILGKNLRYASQYLAFALPGNTKSLVPRFTDLQDQLGDINDISNHIAHTRFLASENDTLLGSEMESRIDAMQEELVRRLEELEVGEIVNWGE